MLCLRHLQSGWGIEELDGDQCKQFLVKWAKRSTHSWVELVQHRKHGLGHEYIPADSIKPKAPESLAAERYMVFRHQQNLPFAGFRSGDTFHVLWIEKAYNELYDHGS